MASKIFITRKIPEIGVNMLLQKGYTIDIYPEDKIIPSEELISTLKAGNYDAVISLLTDKLDATVFDSAPTTKIYSNYATGYDNIDVTSAKERGITIANAPAPATSEAVAEHTIALMLALAARIVEADEFVRRGKYDGWSPMNFIGNDVLGKTLGLIGAGRIGERVAHYSKGLGLNIIYTDVARNERIEKECGAEYFATPDEVLQKADIVSLHVPLLPTTHHLINEARLKMMKPTAILINTSRGPVVDEVALENALREKTISSAGLDVFEFEPKIGEGLIKLQNIILTPHIASASVLARDQMSEIAAQNIIDFLEGKIPANIVNK